VFLENKYTLISENLLYLYGFNFEDLNLLTTSPVISYLNSDTDKLAMLKDNKGKSGVYK
jgi:hypothetical protein